MDLVSLFRVLLSLGFVVVLILIAAWAAKRFGLERRLRPQGSAEARLQVIDQLMIDPRRRLVLIRRDKKEHLVLLGTDRELLIESYDAVSVHAPD